MKYIRGQRGKVYSVSQLFPPKRGEKVAGVEMCRLNLITVDGQRHTYAEYGEHDEAQKVYEYVWRFMGTQYPLLSFAELGREGKPCILYITALEEFGVPEPDVIVFDNPDGGS